MRVVVERAPANTSGILRVRGQLVVNPGVAQRVFREAFHLIDGLGGISMSNEFRVQVPGAAWGLQWKPKVIHGEDIFQEFGLLKITDSSSLASLIELMG